MGFSPASTKPPLTESVLQAAPLCVWRTRTPHCAPMNKHLFMNTQWINVIYTILLYLYVYIYMYISILSSTCKYAYCVDFFNKRRSWINKYWWIWYDFFACSSLWCRLTEKLLLQLLFLFEPEIKRTVLFAHHRSSGAKRAWSGPPVLHLFQWNILYIL